MGDYYVKRIVYLPRWWGVDGNTVLLKRRIALQILFIGSSCSWRNDDHEVKRGVYLL